MKTGQRPIEAWLDDLASPSPTPGGGAAAALAASTAASLARMVLAYSIDKPKLAAHRGANVAAAAMLDAARARALQLADEDAEAYAVLNAVFKRPKDDPGRADAMAEAAAGAIAPPTELLVLCARLLDQLEALTQTTSRMLASDLGVAAALAEAGARGAGWNIRANLPLLAAEQDPGGRAAEAEATIERCGKIRAVVDAACR